MGKGRSRGGRRGVEPPSFYLRAVHAYPPLAQEEEHLLAARAARGDASARQKLVRHHLALVVHVARKLCRGTTWLDDLVQEGNIGLMRAAESFDPNAGTRFYSYAIWWIRAFMLRYLREAQSAVRPRARTSARADVSLDISIGESGATHLALIEDDRPGPECHYLSAESDRAVRDALDKARESISERGWEIAYRRLQEDSPRTLAEFAKSWGVSRERVRQVEERTRQLLRQVLEPVVREAG